ncbi:DUF4142 domain-containing protein [Neorhizobium sp. LjRoot104]|uniref:DUF4142 domain-containing protein n=1 Tax=Neorhizobium sp. LjRoot104 TaxID=3342254 RepID=UPI003F502F9D
MRYAPRPPYCRTASRRKPTNHTKLNAAEFKEEYFDDQVDAHEDAVDLFKRSAEGGDNPDLKALGRQHTLRPIDAKHAPAVRPT